jgi:hypothetical protein
LFVWVKGFSLGGSLFDFYISRALPDAPHPYIPILIRTLPLHHKPFLADPVFPEAGGAIEEGWPNDLN